jgi:K+-sensing histidine kinase KdpD
MKILTTLRHWVLHICGTGRSVSFGVAGVSITIATLVNLITWPRGSDQDGHYFALITAVLISALYGGIGPGLMATALAGLSSAYFTLSPQFSMGVAAPGAKERLVVFIIEAVLLNAIARVIRTHHRSKISSDGLQGYFAIPLVVGAATVPKLVFPDLALELPFAFDYVAICSCAWIGGLAPGIIATGLLAVITKFLFLEPLYSLSVASQTETIRVGLFVGEGLLLTLLGGSHASLKRFAAKATERARTYVMAALHKEVTNAAIRAVSRDTVWEWELDSGEITRTPSWQDKISIALPVKETFPSWVGRIHPEDRDATVNRIHQALSDDRESFQYTYRLLAPSGTFLSIWDHAFIVRGSDWKALRVIGRSEELLPSRLRGVNEPS